MSQSGLAEIAAVNRATQGAWERGDQTPSAEFLAKFAAVGVDVLYVVTGVRAQQPPVLEAHLTHEEISLLEDYRLQAPKANLPLGWLLRRWPRLLVWRQRYEIHLESECRWAPR